MANRQIAVNVPEEIFEAEHTDEARFARELSLLAAIKLYELGKLSSGGAAELAELSRIEFLAALSRYPVFPLEDELHEVEQDRA